MGFLDKIVKAATQRFPIEIARAHHIESSRLQGLCNQAGIVGRRRQRRLGVGAVTDDECNSLFRLLGRGKTQGPRQSQTKQHAKRKKGNDFGHRHPLISPLAIPPVFRALNGSQPEWSLNEKRLQQGRARLFGQT